MFIQLKSCTKFAAHMELCDHVESMEDNVLEFSLRGRHNYFLMENDDSVRYILYVFLIKTEEQGFMMKMVDETEKIPNTDCPMFLIRQSTLNHPDAMAWRHMISEMDMYKEMERQSISNEKFTTCVCRHTNNATNDGEMKIETTSTCAH